jgi:putative ubiquitin-RnfH superfamily antitoxin RatB of RatAB toxin-antitoxin module
MAIEVIYPLPEQQHLYSLSYEADMTVEQALCRSGLLEDYPELDLSTINVGIWGKRTELSVVLTDKDRIEIYRPLHIDPKEARRIRAKNK